MKLFLNNLTMRYFNFGCNIIILNEVILRGDVVIFKKKII